MRRIVMADISFMKKGPRGPSCGSYGILVASLRKGLTTSLGSQDALHDPHLIDQRSPGFPQDDNFFKSFINWLSCMNILEFQVK
jgi:hypothetical protein